ncbi:methyltransferase domain-containing protein [Chitinophaga horti]|uniref:Methyltransferase domain-containing protein n=1 Tax=Chitinophaga horti TaxID=2920382 RepID=A0ABY6J056_9BACT|nr:methyltransferase domain-containing protein [Chitinophaga horti]UYQ91532.1 methyltransferase domain-containing protein [Chitinophaga horti]
MSTWDAGLYKEQHSFVFQYGSDLLSWLQPLEAERILDAGCGTGELTAEIAASGASVKGIDLSASMIKSAKAHYPAMDFETADIATFELEERFDAIFSNATLHWVREKEKAAGQLYKHLKPGGRLVLEMGGKDNVSGILKALEQAMAKYGKVYKPFWYFPSVAEYTTVLENAGFRVNRVHYFDRETTLKDNENGIIRWLDMFGSHFFEGIEATERNAILEETQRLMEPTHFNNGKWTADYKRLRVLAVKPATAH